jgi:hypothetical protein
MLDKPLPGSNTDSVNTELVAGSGESPSNCPGMYPDLQNMHGGQSEDLIGDMKLLDMMEAIPR